MFSRALVGLLALVCAGTALAAEPSAGLDAAINTAITPLANALSGVIFYAVDVGGVKVPLIVGWLVIAAAFFTVRLGFINLRGFGHALRLVRGDYSDPNSAGEVSHFQALATAVSGTVGLGNIAGVAIAISIGGPGAAFWMVLAGFLGMSTKFVECTLGVKYRQTNADGSVSGGPMYYLRHGLAEIGLPRLGRWMALAFAVCCIGGTLGAGNLFQINQVYQQMVNITGGAGSVLAGNAALFGIAWAVVLGLVIIGGIKSIAKVTDKLVPFMAVLYIGSALIVLLANAAHIPDAFVAIFNGAFSAEGVTGGVIGAMIQGFRRAAFSNESGIGTSPIAHAAVKTDTPVTEGFVSLLEPFIDTIVICTMTALVMVVTGLYTQPGMSGVELTSAAFGSVHPFFRYVLTASVVLFAFSTQISYSYYGLKAWTYLFGESRAMDVSFKLLFLAVCVIGCTLSLDTVVDVSDAMFFSMGVVNIIGLYLLVGVVRTDLAAYWKRLQRGELKLAAATAQ